MNAELTELECGTPSWVVEVLSERRRSLVHIENELPLEDVLDFLTDVDKV
jgi:hypothetical protein